MDIDVLARQVQELVAWKKRVEPMLADALVEYETYQARRAPAEVEAEAERKAAVEQAEADRLAAEEAARKTAEQNPAPPPASPPAAPPA